MVKKTPSTNHLAQLTDGSYSMGSKKNKSDRVKDTKNSIANTDYDIHAGLSDSGVTVYQHKKDKNNVVISHRGTLPGGRKGMKDLFNDATLTLGINFAHKKRMNQRKRTTEKAIRTLKPKQLHLTGHSLGGHSVNHSIAGSKLIRDNLTSANTFNGARTLTSNLKISKSEKAKLKGKIIHHRVSGDIVSIAGKIKPALGGKVKTTKSVNSSKKKKSLIKKALGRHPLGLTYKAATAHSLDNFIKK